ncbi:uncharacterized protein PSFLO_03631 [Pseudozyma flocculosa]|uniref:Uncharacterized protein n=1 Tax=Pseudozyma flocculosa TaxID=84751 RepID=A0A5C3F0W4_9BASI|nr:uncharacterized protein PSFLO_03631 [Pseudozyma flocculosa]
MPAPRPYPLDPHALLACIVLCSVVLAAVVCDPVPVLVSLLGSLGLLLVLVPDALLPHLPQISITLRPSAASTPPSQAGQGQGECDCERCRQAAVDERLKQRTRQRRELKREQAAKKTLELYEQRKRRDEIDKRVRALTKAKVERELQRRDERASKAQAGGWKLGPFPPPPDLIAAGGGGQNDIDPAAAASAAVFDDPKIKVKFWMDPDKHVVRYRGEKIP